MQITIDTNNLSEMDIAMLGFLAEQGEPTGDTEQEPEAPTPAPAKATPAKKAAPAKAAPAKPAPEPVEDLLGGDGPTMADAVAAATQLVSTGQQQKVKDALTAVGAKRVSEIAEDQIAIFIDALNAE